MRAVPALVALALIGCAGESPAPVCAAGRVQSCPCPGGAAGAQECGPSGLAWGACVCPGDAGADAGADAGDASSAGDSDVSAPDDVADVPMVDDAGRLADGGCPAGWAVCAGASCVDLATSTRFCGSCAYGCGTGQTCTSGRCVTTATGVTCDARRGDCDGNAANGCEVDVATDRSNCGGCGRACVGAREVCLDGACVPR